MKSCRYPIGFILLFSFFFLRGSSAFGWSSGEALHYDLTWTGIKVGSASLETKQEGDRIQVLSSAVSSGWVSLVYKVEDRTQSVLQRHSKNSPFQSKRYIVKIREGGYRRSRETEFDHSSNTAIFTDHISGEKKMFNLDGTPLDPLSGLLFVRSMKLEPGRPVYVDVFDNRQYRQVEVQVLKRERIKTKAGEFDTVVIRPMLRSEGIFNRKGDMHIWLTDDEKHVPVMMKTKVALGRVTASLTGGSW